MTTHEMFLRRLLEVCEAATPGPWKVGEVKKFAAYPVHDGRETKAAVVTVPHWEFGNEPLDNQAARDLAFVVAARSALPVLIRQALAALDGS